MAELQKSKQTNPVSLVSAKDEDEIVERRTLRDYYIILRERLWIALPLALLVSISLGYYQSREVPLYESVATMQFEKPERIVTIQGVTNPEVTSEVDMNTYMEQLRSAKLQRDVVTSLTLDEVKILQRPYFRDLQPGQQPPSAGAALGSVEISSVRNSYIIRIRSVHRDPEAASIVANKYVDRFMNMLLLRTSGTNENAVDMLKREVEMARQEALDAANKFREYMKRNNLVSLDDSYNMANKNLEAVSSKLTANRLVRIEYETMLDQVESYRKQGKNLVEIQFIATHGQVTALKESLAELTRKQSVAAERYLERHPVMIQLANEIETIQVHLERAISLAIADLQTRLAKIRDEERNLEAERKMQEKQVFALSDLKPEFEGLKNAAEAKEQTYRELMRRLNETTTTKNLNKIPITPLDKAMPAYGPFTPNMSRIVKTCLGVGILVFIAVAVGLSFIDDRIKSSWDVEHFVGATLLGIVPELGQVRDDERYQLVLNNKQTPGLEAFLSIYSSAKIHSKLDFPKSMLVTSTIPGEGKTLVSCNLAGAFARHGKNTLLIDCDLRRPMLHRHFKLPNSAGLITWHDSGADVDSDPLGNPHLGIIKVGENLSLLPSGGRSKSPSELLESGAFAQLLAKLRHRFDLIIVDSPPLGAVTDALLIAERIDEVVYVCRFNRAYRKHIRLYMKALRSGKNEILGVVLNGLSPRRIEYYSNYRYYRSYKKYYGSQS